MLDAETKRRIDTARQILVGKVPDPKSQVEQITIALIYKFMDDMDAAAEEAGGKRKFFAGEFAKYGWAKLMAPSVSGEERINLYAESMVRMPQNPGIPKLFREIFKNAFLPYRDPETLKLFLKEIDGFRYDHSERLGDAFEYLLSVLGSQGDAGQFRTPRHIIDFMVQIVDPKKHESVLDPACGTAGFLISAYKHILLANSSAREAARVNGNGEAALHTSKIPLARGDRLTPDERKKLADNFRGYDISPDMVRLSLVNMYLHGFTDPHVYEYDTLTSQDRWNEMADVILANPPFMSPKGGIKPHNRFSVQSKRSEVLFVDYMAEHLTPSGRAGVIVPEGILYRPQAAYKKLRRMLVRDHLVAVVSLPQGVFEPYASAKTSILVFDRQRAKRSGSILLLRVNHDGFELSITRKPTGLTDLPSASRLYEAWIKAIDNGEAPGSFPKETEFSLLVSRQDIEASGDYRLTADSYRTIEKRKSQFPYVPLSELLKPSKPSRVGEDHSLPILSITMKDGLVQQSEKFKKRIASKDISGYTKVRRNDLVVGFPIDEGVLGIQSRYDYAAVSPAYNIWTVDEKRLFLPFFELVLRSEHARRTYRLRMRGTTGRRKTLDRADFLKIEIPVPPRHVQEQIVASVNEHRAEMERLKLAMKAENAKMEAVIDQVWGEVTAKSDGAGSAEALGHS